MYRVFFLLSLLIAMWALPKTAHAALQFQADQTVDGVSFMLVTGDFDYNDDLTVFEAIARSSGAVGVIFQSAGGNPHKAMELGRIIRRMGLGTVQPRAMECASACALAFLGGVMRYAEPGAIGVHKSSFRAGHSLNTDKAVSEIQHLTAEIVSYMVEMGVDPSLLELALQYDSDDIRYLSKSEMEKYRVVTSGGGEAQPQVADRSLSPFPQSPPQPPVSTPTGRATTRLDVPQAFTGRVRHPKGSVPVKALADGEAMNLANLRNGTPVTILGNDGRWYRVQAGGIVGYMHDTWVFVDQFDSGVFGERHIQIKSFDNLADSEAYVRGSSLPLSAYLATNGWFAITLEDTFDEAVAKALVKKLKAQGAIPDDSYVTYGNTYVRKVCCD